MKKLSVLNIKGEKVKDITHCSTGCGGCYDKVMAILSDAMND